MRDAITALFLASASSRDRAPRRLEEEVRAVGHAARGGRAWDRVRLVPCCVGRTRDLQDALLRHDPQIVHLAGPGDDPCVLCLGDGQGRVRRVGVEPLATLFGMLREWIRVVILNGCDTLPAVDALGQVVDYAIGIDRPLSDPAAIAFAQVFYGALAMGCNVQASFSLAANRLRMEGGSAVLRVHPGVDPSVPLLSSFPLAGLGHTLHPAARA